jgi:ABC-type transport system involved in multi-copper enzyme maturation permease subunit
MRTLLWKEWREKRLWAIPLLVSTVGLVAAGKGYTFSGDFSTFSRWIWLSFLVALFFGMSAYSRDLSSGTMDFTYARPVSWKKTLASKLLIGLGLIIASTILAAIVYRLTSPAEYAHVATPVRLMWGALEAAVIMSACYLLGAACSVAVSGYVGSLLIVIVAAMSIAAREYVVHTLSSFVPIPAVLPFWWTTGIVVGLACAALIAVRFGLTLSTGARLRRYTLVAALILVVSAPLDLLQPTTAWEENYGPVWVDSTASPTGEYVVCRELRQTFAYLRDIPRPVTDDYPGRINYRLIRLSDYKQGLFALESYQQPPTDVIWTAPGVLVLTEQKLTDEKGNPPTPEELQNLDTSRFYFGLQVRGVAMDAGGRLHQRLVWAERRNHYNSNAVPSANQQLLLVTSNREYNPPVRTYERDLRVWSLGTLKPVTPYIHVACRHAGWQSNTEIGYTDTTGKRHIIRVVPPEAKQ